ncbi:MAG: PAS domain-containing protein, partial [Deltaproteobacteria bacterium]|nr:PAS domain-containing protein [Deltaproteobacteria bacterium]
LANNDLRNLLNSTQIPTIFLDNNLIIKRFTDQIATIFNLISTDVGRPITDIVSRLQYDRLAQDVRTVLETLTFQEQQVRTADGRWFTMRIMPYRTMENRIEGTVITFIDITQLKEMETLQKEKEHLRLLTTVVKDASDAFVLQDLEGKILAWNRGAERLYGWSEEEALGQSIFLIIPEAQREEYVQQLELLRKGETLGPVKSERQTRQGTVVAVTSSATSLTYADGQTIAIAVIDRVA